MARNGSGTYAKVNTFVASATITAAGHNQNWDDIALEMTNSVAVDGQSTMTGTLKLPNGTAALPAWTFGSDPDCGGYRIGANNIGISVAETKILDIASTGLSITGTLTPSGQIVSSAGTVGAPGISFASDLDCGLYRIGANNIGVAVNGAKVLDIATTGLGITGVGTITSASANALCVGLAGATNPALQIDASTASSATGLKVKSAAAASGLAVSVISSGTDENLTIDAKGSGTIGIAPTSTGAVTITPATTVTGALTANAAGGVTAKNTLKAAAKLTWTAGTPALTKGFNVSSSVTDNGTGDVTITFSTALADAHYIATATAHDTEQIMAMVHTQTTTTLRVITRGDDGAAQDPTSLHIMVMDPA